MTARGTYGGNPLQGWLFRRTDLSRLDGEGAWQVFDDTTGGEVILWTVDEKEWYVHIENTQSFHEYTLKFMAKIVWHPVLLSGGQGKGAEKGVYLR